MYSDVEGLRRDHYRRHDGSVRSALLMARTLTGSLDRNTGHTLQSTPASPVKDPR